MNNLYSWAVWLHILAAFIFFFSHGTALAIAFLLPKQKDANLMKALLEVTGITILPLSASMLATLVTVIYMAVAAAWWRTGWWWLSFAVFFAMIVWMTWYSRVYYSPIRKALGLEYMTGFGTQNPAEQPAGMDEVRRLVMQTKPWLLTWVGLAVTAVLLWLMRFKPF